MSDVKMTVEKVAGQQFAYAHVLGRFVDVAYIRRVRMASGRVVYVSSAGFLSPSADVVVTGLRVACAECGGFGTVERQADADWFIEEPCPICAGFDDDDDDGRAEARTRWMQ